VSDFPTGVKIPTRPPNCLKCAFYKIDWSTKNRTFLRGCEIFSFMSMNLPSYEVFRSTGSHCPSFRLKEGLKE
jgi:hypothetical protein